MRIKARSVRYHRNGVFGEGFYAVSFLCGKFHLIGAVWINEETGEAKHYAVLSPNDISRRWRGDDFLPELLRVIAAAPETEKFGVKAAPEFTATDPAKRHIKRRRPSPGTPFDVPPDVHPDTPSLDTSFHDHEMDVD